MSCRLSPSAQVVKLSTSLVLFVFVIYTDSTAYDVKTVMYIRVIEIMNLILLQSKISIFLY